MLVLVVRIVIGVLFLFGYCCVVVWVIGRWKGRSFWNGLMLFVGKFVSVVVSFM